MSKESTYQFPIHVFVQNYLNIDLSDIYVILSCQSNGYQIAKEVVKKKIDNLSIIHQNSLNEILQSVKLISISEYLLELRNLITEKLIELLHKCDFVNKKEESIEFFKIVLNILKDNENCLNITNTIEKFNKIATDETKFILWQATKYFNPEIVFFNTNVSRLLLADFRAAPIEFHKSYFANNFELINDLNSIVGFGELTFLVIETPFPVLKDIFKKLEPNYQAAYWLNFPKIDDFLHCQYYEANYNWFDIPYNINEFIVYLQDLSSLSNLIVASKLIKGIQHLYSTAVTSYNLKKEGFLKINKNDRQKIIQELISKQSEISNAEIVELFTYVLGKSDNENCVSICSIFIPKFINEKVLPHNELVAIIDELSITAQYKQSIFSQISIETTTINKILLWINGQSVDFDFDLYKIDFIFLTPRQQILFLKKLFWLKHTGQFDFTIDNLKELTRIDHDILNQTTSVYSNVHIDISIEIIIESLNSFLKTGKFLVDNDLLNIVYKSSIVNSEQKLQILDLFERCRGRYLPIFTWESAGSITKTIYGWEIILFRYDRNLVEEIKKLPHRTYNPQSQTWLIPLSAQAAIMEFGHSFHFGINKEGNKYANNMHLATWQRNFVPESSFFCDGQFANNPDQTYNIPFWWCNNSPCYKNCAADHTDPNYIDEPEIQRINHAEDHADLPF